ncbi:DEAD-box ATP-dependent RNA helicase DeaD (= CshA) [hydrothermal vent metagenome]|uniref:RNA helicase n=1 Tax=hydrothermal vent metagenome TaxID=652676 RepID=A0A3B1CHH1_9ZZZZ
MLIEPSVTPEVQVRFEDFDLIPPVFKALSDVGYESPSPIQAAMIPHMLAGKDVVGQAHTGTGKTAAFALPLLSMIDVSNRNPQVLVLAPTRELAIQVAESFKTYAAHIKGFNILPIYGGQEYQGQLRQLKRGAHVIVGTPGRVIDHLKRSTMDLSYLRCLVLDEADEMLRMGFIDDVEWILEKTPEKRQIALFSATMPSRIRHIAQRYLESPVEVTIKTRTTTATTIRQRYWMVSGLHKLDALTRILEAETYDGILIFVRTKTATVELAERLQTRGYAASALNGDIPQAGRERTIAQLKSGKIDLLVATDVAARGLDVERISHVINYEIPYDTEAYVHRIGRTGRAGRTGEAILFASPRERRLLKEIERATKQKIELMTLPSPKDIQNIRVARFKQQITDVLGCAEDLSFYRTLVDQYREEHAVSDLDIAAALVKLAQKDRPLLMKVKPISEKRPDFESVPRRLKLASKREPGRFREVPEDMERFRIEVGHQDGVQPGNIVGAITNEAGLRSKNIGHIKIYTDYSTVDLPKGMPPSTFSVLKECWVSGRQLNISRFGKTVPKEKGKVRRFMKAKSKATRGH